MEGNRKLSLMEELDKVRNIVTDALERTLNSEDGDDNMYSNNGNEEVEKIYHSIKIMMTLVVPRRKMWKLIQLMKH